MRVCVRLREKRYGFGPCTEHAKKELGKEGMVKGLPKYITTVNIPHREVKGVLTSKMTRVCLLWVKPIMFKWLNVFHDTK